jgi:hypothetical protein
MRSQQTDSSIQAENKLTNHNGAGESFGTSATHFGLVEGLIMRGNLNLEAFTSDPGRLSKHAIF